MTALYTNAIQVVLTIFIMIGLGFFLSRKGFLDASGNRLLSNLVVRVALPGTIISNLFTKFDRATLLGSGTALLVPLIGMSINFPISLLLSRLLKIPKNRQGVFFALTTFSNTVFIGFPVTRALLGDDGISCALLYYLVNTCLFWSIGASLIQRDGNDAKLSVRENLKRLFNLPLVTLALCIAMILVGLTPPMFIMDAAQYIGSMVTPLSMIFIGAMLSDVLKKGLRWMPGYGAVLAVRFLLSPLIAVIISGYLGLDPLFRQAFFLQAGMPTMTQIAIVAHAYGADGEYASGGTALTTFFLLPFIPLYALALTYLH